MKIESQGHIETQPYKGARDFYPDDMKVRNYIFGVWREVCKSYGYQEYDGPYLEAFSLYAAKSGEEIVNEQLYSFEDRGGRKVAIRPEMTPTLARMVAAKHKTLPLPIRWFSIPNLWRYEKPQRGRLREHFQLNVDVFGVNSVEADFEICSIAIDIMKRVGARKGMFEIRVGNRRLIEDVYKSLGISTEQGLRVSKAIDKIKKIHHKEFDGLLKGDADITDEQVKEIKRFIKDPQPKINELVKTSKGAKEVKDILRLAKETGKEKYIKYDPTIMRGFDYYTGNVFEQYDLNPSNKRAMYGGGRYDDLVELFIGKNLSGVGFGMGDVTFKNFLDSWGLMPHLPSEVEYFVTVWPGEEIAYKNIAYEVSHKLRHCGLDVEMWLEDNTKLNKQLKYADKKGIKNVIIIGEEEIKNGIITVKNMDSGEQKALSLDSFLEEIVNCK
ncbi:histidine--tRNA ligase [candidate division WWE3 bacterium]|jgi:histidyl-tRNA synthetase|nr:histidine--tRNA ligase [candidate division WWE3 bacterium]MBT7350712.1 histidine--tRNA ligase [candidate division WWE3 bacterium]